MGRRLRGQTIWMLESFIDRLHGATSLEELNSCVRSLRDIFDVEHIVYHSVNSTGEQYAALTYSDDWVSQYLEEEYSRIDPVVQACHRRFHPFNWKDLNWSGRAVQNFLGEALSTGVGNQGISMPIHGPSGQFALFSVNGKSSDTQWEKFTQERRQQVILLGHFINQKALELERGSDHATLISLSPRETDALTLLALGFSRARAADHLAISEHTLRVYIEGARLKLGATNTTHAVALALSRGYLTI